MSYIVTSSAPPAGSILVYEAEWNEEATADQHRDAICHFATEKRLPLDEIDSLPALNPDDAVYFTGDRPLQIGHTVSCATGRNEPCDCGAVVKTATDRFPMEVRAAMEVLAEYAVRIRPELTNPRAEQAARLRAYVEAQCEIAVEDPDWEQIRAIQLDPLTPALAPR